MEVMSTALFWRNTHFPGLHAKSVEYPGKGLHGNLLPILRECVK